MIDPQMLGRELEVGAVLTGHIVQQGDSLNVQAELLSVEDGRQLWGEQYQHKLQELVTVQNNIAMEISQALRLQLTVRSSNELRRAQVARPSKRTEDILNLVEIGE